MIHQKKKTTLIFANRKKGQGRMNMNTQKYSILATKHVASIALIPLVAVTNNKVGYKNMFNILH